MRKRSPSAPVARTRRARAPLRGVLQLPSLCTLAAADDLKAQLAGLVRDVKPITLDAHGVERIDAASMQLLAALFRDRCTSSLSSLIHRPSPAFLEAQRLLGLDALFTDAARTRAASVEH